MLDKAREMARDQNESALEVKIIEALNLALHIKKCDLAVETKDAQKNL
jgi:hypothetical protein